MDRGRFDGRDGVPETPQGGVADRIAQAAQSAFGLALPVGLRAWDGSQAGPSDGPIVVLRTPRAVRRLVGRSGGLGLARAFVAGEIDVEGDLRQGLRQGWEFVRQVRTSGWRASAQWPALLRLAVQIGGLGFLPPPPTEESRFHGRSHTAAWDRAAIAHHYDLGNEFYAAILDPSMAYSCAYWTSDEPGYDLADAQRDKLELVCRELRLQPGDRLLDVGCGWGPLIVHAARHHGVRATGVTVSEKQYEFTRDRIADLGLGALVEVRLQDYRDISALPFDAVASIEMGEHVGERNYPAYCAVLHRFVKPGGRVLVQQMARGDDAPGGGAFIERYIAPEMSMRPLPRTLGHLEGAGLEILSVKGLREHYTRTIDAWAQALDRGWDDIVRRYGDHRARVWRLYLAGAALAFEESRLSVHQILAIRPVEANGFPADMADAGATAEATATAESAMPSARNQQEGS